VRRTPATRQSNRNSLTEVAHLSQIGSTGGFVRPVRRSSTLPLLVLILALLAPLPAYAAPGAARSWSDPKGDQAGDGPDLRAVRVDNGGSYVEVTVRLTRLVPGRLVVDVAPRGGPGVRLTSTRLASGRTVTTGCPGLHAAWAGRSARLRMPAGCLAYGEYGEVRVSVRTEVAGRVADRVATAGWVARG
jgi:hypothetical protein